MRMILQAFSAFASKLPLARALALGRALGWAYGSVIRYHRRDALAAVRRSLPDKTDAEVRTIVAGMYRNLGMNLVELFRLRSAPDEYIKDFIVFEEERHLHETLKRGKGMLVLSAHLGNWDLLCTTAPRFNFPLTIITKEIKNRALNDYWMDVRRRFGLKFVPAHQSYRLCLSALRKNEVVGFILDQNMTRDEGIFVDFFGRPACTTPGLAYMSMQSGAPVVPVFMIRRENGRHLIKVLPPIEPPPDRSPETIRDFTQRYTKVIEDMIRQYPDQWIWVHRRWRTVPQDSGAPV